MGGGSGVRIGFYSWGQNTRPCIPLISLLGMSSKDEINEKDMVYAHLIINCLYDY